MDKDNKRSDNKEKAKRLFAIIKERLAGAEVRNTSVLIAYYLLLSFFPLIIVIGNLLPYLNIPVEAAMEYISLAVPEQVQPMMETIVYGLITSSSGGLLSLGLLGAIWSASRGINYLQIGMNKAYGIPKAGNFISKRLVSILTILLILLLLVVFALVFSFGQALLSALAPTLPWAGGLLNYIVTLKWPVMLLFLFLLMVLLYRITPDAKVRLRDTLPGAGLATVGLSVLVQAFTLFLRHFTLSYTSYGTIGTVFVLMFWINFSITIVLAGAVLNASISEYRFGKAEETFSGVDNVIRNTQTTLAQRLRRLMAKKK